MKIFSYPGVQFSQGFPKVEGAKRYTPFQLKTTSEKHMQITQKPVMTEIVPMKDRVATNFMDTLNQLLGNVEELSNESEELTRKSVYDPDTVDVHDVMIAAQKARFALNLTKTISDALIRAYRELITPR